MDKQFVDDNYLLISDTHFHEWRSLNSLSGGKTRLDYVLEDLTRHFKWANAQGITKVVHAGDVFHVRGSLSPKVVNKVMGAFEHWTLDLNMEFFILSGNHDLTTDRFDFYESGVGCLTPYATAIETQGRIFDGFVIINWIPDLRELQMEIKAYAATLGEVVGNYDLILHAPMNKVIKGIPETGLDPEKLAEYGFRNVFCGHYHNHKRFEGNVWSIGASNHQTWGDVGSKAGVLVVEQGKVRRRDTTAPKFVDFNGSDFSQVSGNFVRMKTEDLSKEEIDLIVTELKEKQGALGVYVSNQLTGKETKHDVVASTSLDSLEESVVQYATKKHNENVADYCAKIIKETVV